MEIFQDVIEQNKKTTLEDEFRNFFDMYLAGMKEELKNNREFTTFSGKQYFQNFVFYVLCQWILYENNTHNIDFQMNN